MLALSTLAFRSFTSNRLRSGLLIAAVLLGVAGVSGVQLTNDAISRGVERSWRTAVGISHLQIRAFGGTGFSERSIAGVRSLQQVVRVAPVVRKWVFFRTPTQQRGFIELIGADPRTEGLVRSYRVQSGEFLSSDRPNGVLLRASLAQRYGLQVGDIIELITRDGLRDFDLIGLLAEDEAGIASYGSVVLISIDTARQQFGMEDRANAMSLLLSSEAAIPLVTEALVRTVPEAHIVRRSEDVRASLEQSLAELQATFTLFGATAFFVAIFLILNTIEMTVASQTQETGRLRAAGATRGQIFLYFLEHGLVPGAIGSVAGSLVGYVLARGIGAWIERSQDIAVAPVAFSLPVLGLSAAAGIVTVTLASVTPAWRASRSNPIEMIYAGASEATAATGLSGAILGILLVAASLGALAVAPQGEPGRLIRAGALFPLLAGLVLISRVVIRPLSALVGLPFRWVGTPSQRLAVRNLTRHVGRTTLTVAGFMVSLALLMGVTSLALSSVRAGERWTRALIPGEYVVVSPVDQPPAFIGEFAKLPGVRKASAVGFFSTQIGDSLVQVASIDPEVFFPGFDFVEGSPGDATAAMRAGAAVVIPRRLARERDLHVGQELLVQTGSGPQPFRIAGVVAHSFPSPDGARTLLVGSTDAERLFDRKTFRLIFIQAAEGEDLSRLKDRVGELAERYGMSAISAEEISSQVAAAIWNLLVLIGALVGIGLVIGAFGTANTMLMNIAERAWEFTILWGVGMSRVQLQVMTVVEAALLGLMGGIFGVAVGGLLSWLLVSMSRTSGFEPEYVFPFPAAVGGVVVSIIASAVAAYLPARRVKGLEAAW